MTRTVFLILLLLTHIDSKSSGEQQSPRTMVDTRTQSEQESRKEVSIQPFSLSNTLGVVVLSEKHRERDFISIYNQDGSLWQRFTFYDNPSFNQTNAEFSPFAFHPDYFVFTLTCVGKVNGRYEVIVNEETQIRKYINVRDRALKFETWKAHILHVNHIEFNSKENPLLTTPNGQPIEMSPFSLVSPVSAVEIRGEWLRVEWNNALDESDPNSTFNTAWVRWKKDGKLLIGLVYLC